MAKLSLCFPREKKKKKKRAWGKKANGRSKAGVASPGASLDSQTRNDPFCLPWGPRGGLLPGVGEQVAMQGEKQPQKGRGFSRSPGPCSIVSPHLLSEPPT